MERTIKSEHFAALVQDALVLDVRRKSYRWQGGG